MTYLAVQSIGDNVKSSAHQNVLGGKAIHFTSSHEICVWTRRGQIKCFGETEGIKFRVSVISKAQRVTHSIETHITLELGVNDSDRGTGIVPTCWSVGLLFLQTS